MPSVYGSILTSVKTLVSALSGLTTTNQVVVRKRLAFVKQADAAVLQAGLPFVCIAPTAERLFDSHMSNSDHVLYPVQVAVIRESALALADPEPTLLLRERIRQRLRTATLTGVDAVYNQDSYDPSPAFDASGFDAALDVSVQEFAWVSLEVRNQ